LPEGRILDLGAGPGTSAVEMARAAPGRRFVAVDRAAAMLPRARRRAAAAGVALPLLRADALALPFRAGCFDGAAGHSVLYLLPDARAALAELRRVVRPGGRVAFLEPREGAADGKGAFGDGLRFGAAMRLWRVMSALHGRFTETSLAALLGAAGFVRVSARPALRGFGVVATGEAPGLTAPGAGP
jgi:ubiquinone/menaquinone biosynthesis C-methylase UbiE